MSQGAQIDYDALAKRYGAVSSQAPQPQSQTAQPQGAAPQPQGQPDYEALAKQYGATSSKPPEAAPEPSLMGRIGHGVSEFGSDLWGAAKGAAGVLLPQVSDIKASADSSLPLSERAKAIVRANPVVGPLYKAGAGYVGAVQQANQQAEDAAAKGDTAGAAINSAAAGLPLVGPMVSGIYEQAKSGDTAGALGRGASRAVQLASMAPEDSAIPNPATGALNAVQRVAEPAKAAANRALLLGRTPEAAYESALKPSTTLGAAKTTRIIQAGLEHEIPVSPAGVERIGELIEDLNDKIGQGISRGKFNTTTGQPVTVDPNAVATRLDAVRSTFQNQALPESDVAAVDQARQEFLRARGQLPGAPAKPTGMLDQYGKPIMGQPTPPTPASPIPVEDAQSLKVGTYKQLKGKAYGELKTATIESQKALARGLKEEIEPYFPELHKLNADEGRLLDLQPVMAKAVARIANHQLIGIGTPIAMGAVKTVTGSAKLGVVAGLVKAVLDDPIVKSRLAISIAKGGNVTMPAALARIQSYQNSLALPASQPAERESF